MPDLEDVVTAAVDAFRYEKFDMLSTLVSFPCCILLQQKRMYLPTEKDALCAFATIHRRIHSRGYSLCIGEVMNVEETNEGTAVASLKCKFLGSGTNVRRDVDGRIYCTKHEVENWKIRLIEFDAINGENIRATSAIY